MSVHQPWVVVLFHNEPCLFMNHVIEHILLWISHFLPRLNLNGLVGKNGSNHHIAITFITLLNLIIIMNQKRVFVAGVNWKQKRYAKHPDGCCKAALHLGTDPGAEVLGAVDTGIVAGRVAVVDIVGTDPGAKGLAIT